MFGGVVGLVSGNFRNFSLPHRNVWCKALWIRLAEFGTASNGGAPWLRCFPVTTGPFRAAWVLSFLHSPDFDLDLSPWYTGLRSVTCDIRGLHDLGSAKNMDS